MNQYITLTLFNDTNTNIPVNIRSNRGENILDQNENYNVVCVKFSVDNRLIPCFIPRIGLTNTFFTLPIPNYTSNQYLPLYDAYKQKTEMTIAIMYIDTLTENIYYSSKQVEWTPQNLGRSLPTAFDRQNVINNDYFYCYNSIHLMKLITNTLNYIVSIIPELVSVVDSELQYFEIVKSTDGYNLLINEKFQTINMSIHFSPQIASMFGFQYTPSTAFKDTTANYSQLVINYNFISTFSTDYLYIGELYRVTNGIFPFSTLQLTSSDINVNELQVYDSLFINKTRPTQQIITDFDLLVDDPDKFYSMISYVTNSFDRKINLLTTQTQIYTIQMMLKTPDGYITEIKIQPNTYANCYLCFTPIK